MNLYRALTSGEARTAWPSLSLDDYAKMLTYNGLTYFGLQQTQPGGKVEDIAGDFRGLVRGAYKSNGVVFATILARQLVFSEARFQFRRIRDGRPGELFGTSALAPLETPWPGGTTGDLLSRMEQDASLGGNAFVARRPGGTLRRLRPDWVTIMLGSNNDPEVAAWDVDADIIGYAYTPGGPGSGRDPEFFLPEEVAHYAPIPDPEAMYRGMSWLTPVISEILGDKAMTEHKIRFFENGATVNLVVSLPLEAAKTTDNFEKWVEKFRGKHEGLENAYRTVFLGGGADVKAVGANLEQLQFKITQGAGETRIAAAGGVAPIIVGLSEGLEAATYANYGQARRRFADATMRPLWRNAAGSLARIIDVPTGAELWYDDRDISFLQEDRKDAAEIQGREAVTIRQLVDAGFEPQSIVDAVTAEDWSRLVHTGLFSVQLQPPGPRIDPTLNRNGGGDPAALIGTKE